MKVDLIPKTVDFDMFVFEIFFHCFGIAVLILCISLIQFCLLVSLSNIDLESISPFWFNMSSIWTIFTSIQFLNSRYFLLNFMNWLPPNNLVSFS